MINLPTYRLVDNNLRLSEMTAMEALLERDWDGVVRAAAEAKLRELDNYPINIGNMRAHHRWRHYWYSSLAMGSKFWVALRFSYH